MFTALKSYFSKTDTLWSKFAAEAEKKAMFTPDAGLLRQLERVNLFVYNECQSGGPKHNLLGTPKYNGFGYTESSDYVLYKKLLGEETYPIALPITEDKVFGRSSFIGDPGQIMGEIYTIEPASQLIELDNYMLNTVQFNRQRVKVVIPYYPSKDSPVETCVVDVFMYVGDYDFWKDQLSDPDAKKLFVPSRRMFCVKDSNYKDTLNAHYLFDHTVEANAF